MGEKEKVVVIGWEGGRATIYRTPIDGGWQFHIETYGMYLDENDDEDWQSWTSEPVQTIQEALSLIEGNHCWVFFHPTFIHHEFRMIVWDLVHEAASKLSEEHRKTWEDRFWRLRYWQRLCLEQT